MDRKENMHTLFDHLAQNKVIYDMALLYDAQTKGSIPIHPACHTDSLLAWREHWDKLCKTDLLSILNLKLHDLSSREIEVLSLWITGFSLKETASKLGGISTRTIETH